MQISNKALSDMAIPVGIFIYLLAQALVIWAVR